MQKKVVFKINQFRASTKTITYITQHVSNQMFIIREVNSDMPSKYIQNKCWKKSDALSGIRTHDTPIS